MKYKAIFMGALVAGLLLPGPIESKAAEKRSAAKSADDPDRILQFLNESDSAIQLSAEEEAAHVERIHRLYELEKQKPIAEPAGAETGIVDTNSLDASNEDKVLERLIEAIEQLQMEIRDFRTSLRKSREPEAAVEKPKAFERPVPSSTLP